MEQDEHEHYHIWRMSQTGTAWFFTVPDDTGRGLRSGYPYGGGDCRRLCPAV